MQHNTTHVARNLEEQPTRPLRWTTPSAGPAQNSLLGYGCIENFDKGWVARPIVWATCPCYLVMKIRRLAGVFCGCSCCCCCCVLSFSSWRGFLRPPPSPPSPPASFHIALYHLICCSSSFLRPVVASWFVCVSGCAPAPCPLCVPWLPPLRLPCLFWSVCSPCLLLPFLLVLMLAVSFSCLMFLACFLCFAFMPFVEVGPALHSWSFCPSWFPSALSPRLYIASDIPPSWWYTFISYCLVLYHVSHIISSVAPPRSCGPSWLHGSSASQAVLLLHAFSVSLGCLLCVCPAFSDLYAPLAFCFPLFLSWCLRSPFLVSCFLPAFSVLPFAFRWSWPCASFLELLPLLLPAARRGPPSSFHIALYYIMYHCITYHLICCSSSFLRPVVASWFVCVSGCAPAPCPLCVPWLPPLRLPCLFWSVCSPCLLLPFVLVLMPPVSFSCLMFLACFLCFAFCSTTHPRTTMPPDYRQMCQTLFLIY